MADYFIHTHMRNQFLTTRYGLKVYDLIYTQIFPFFHAPYSRKMSVSGENFLATYCV